MTNRKDKFTDATAHPLQRRAAERDDESQNKSVTGAIMARLNRAETDGEPSEFCDGLRIAADIAADVEA